MRTPRTRTLFMEGGLYKPNAGLKETYSLYYASIKSPSTFGVLEDSDLEENHFPSQ